MKCVSYFAQPLIIYDFVSTKSMISYVHMSGQTDFYNFTAFFVVYIVLFISDYIHFFYFIFS